MEFLNKVELIGRLGDHYTEEQFAPEIILYKFQIRVDNRYTSVSGAEVQSTTWFEAHLITHPTSRLRGFIFRPRAAIHVIGRLQMDGRPPIHGAYGYVINVAEGEYLEEEPEEKEASK